MTLRDKIKETIYKAIDNYDFSFKIEEALESAHIEDYVYSTIQDTISYLNFDEIIEEKIKSIIDEEMDSNELMDYVTDAINDEMEMI